MSFAAWPARVPEEVADLSPPRDSRPHAHVWLVELAAIPGVDALSAEERARASACVALEARARFTASRSALRRILSAYLRIAPAAVPICYPVNGKPHVACPGPDFNLSHSGDRMLVAVCAAARVGVDLEGPRKLPDVLALARRFLTPAEADAIQAGAPDARPALFLRRWTRLEAFVKATGTGIARGLATRPDAGWSLFDLPADPGWFAALAIGSPGAVWRGFRLEWSCPPVTVIS